MLSQVILYCVDHKLSFPTGTFPCKTVDEASSDKDNLLVGANTATSRHINLNDGANTAIIESLSIKEGYSNDNKHPERPDSLRLGFEQLPCGSN